MPRGVTNVNYWVNLSLCKDFLKTALGIRSDQWATSVTNGLHVHPPARVRHWPADSHQRRHSGVRATGHKSSRSEHGKQPVTKQATFQEHHLSLQPNDEHAAQVIEQGALSAEAPAQTPLRMRSSARFAPVTFDRGCVLFDRRCFRTSPLLLRTLARTRRARLRWCRCSGEGARLA